MTQAEFFFGDASWQILRLHGSLLPDRDPGDGESHEDSINITITYESSDSVLRMLLQVMASAASGEQLDIAVEGSWPHRLGRPLDDEDFRAAVDERVLDEIAAVANIELQNLAARLGMPVPRVSQAALADLREKVKTDPPH